MANNGRVNRRKIYRRISEKTDIPVHKVKEAVKHQFDRTADLMASGDREKQDFPSIRLRYFGKFEPNEQKIKHLQENGQSD